MSSINSSPIDFVLLIPCYNNQHGLMASLKSVSYPKEKFEILIVDDGSTVPINKEELVQAFGETVIHIIRLDKNQGIVNALNKGLNALQPRTDIKYIARLDAGDVCDEQRFYKQVDFLNTHADITIVASWARFQDEVSGKGYDYITKTTHKEIVKEMHYKCSFIHPSVMFRKAVLNTIGFYPLTYPHAEDYAFFWKILKHDKGAVIPEKLVNIVFSNKHVSSENYKEQLRSRKEIVKEFGDQRLQKILSLGILNLKLILPKGIIQWLKSLMLPS